MATTRIISMHINKGKTIAQCLKARVDYVKNPDKTEQGELISSYACAPETADQEFLLCRNAYIANTGRHIRNEVIAYQVRQSFKPGEVTPEEANKIGYELASELLGGEFAFIVATHVDKRHVHNHLVFCAYSLDCTHKFKDVLRSGAVVAELSDKLCKEHRLSVIEHPQGKTVSYDKWLADQANLSQRGMLRMIIDCALKLQPDGFDALMQLLEEVGCRIKRGAHVSVKLPDGKRFIRLDSLGDEYTEDALQRTLSGEHVHIPHVPRSHYTRPQIAMLIDIETKMREGKGCGYQVWAERHNIEAISKSVIYLKEHDIDSYDELMNRISSATQRRNEISTRMRSTQSHMKELGVQKTAILNYRRTKEIYTQYQESGWSQDFYLAHKEEIDKHKSAQEVYAKADGKLPTLAGISAEYTKFLEQKRADSALLDEVKAELTDLYHIKKNLDIIAEDVSNDEKEKKRSGRNER